MFEEFGVNSMSKGASTTWLYNPRPSFYNILAKNHPNFLQNLSFESLFHRLTIIISCFGNMCIFDQWLLFDHKQPCIWPLELSYHYEPGIRCKNQRLWLLHDSMNVSQTKFDVQDFWSWYAVVKCSTKVPSRFSDQNALILHFKLWFLIYKINQLSCFVSAW